MNNRKLMSVLSVAGFSQKISNSTSQMLEPGSSRAYDSVKDAAKDVK